MTTNSRSEAEILAVPFEHMVAGILKSGSDILDSLTPVKAHLLHMGVGLPGEVGELLDALKRFAVYGRDLDLENVVEELGDIEFFLEGIRSAVNVTREQTLDANKLKLGKRYASGRYSDAQAIARADKTA